MNSAALHYRQCGGGRLRSPPPDAAVFAAAHSVRQNFNALGTAHRQAYRHRPGALCGGAHLRRPVADPLASVVC